MTKIVWVPAGVPVFVGLGFCFEGDTLQPESDIKSAASRAIDGPIKLKVQPPSVMRSKGEAENASPGNALQRGRDLRETSAYEERRITPRRGLATRVADNLG